VRAVVGGEDEGPRLVGAGKAGGVRVAEDLSDVERGFCGVSGCDEKDQNQMEPQMNTDEHR